MKKLTNKNNIIITCCVLVACLIVAVITSIKFIGFRNYQPKFVIREDVVNEVIKFSDYSKHIKDTKGDSDIYVINGTENTVAVGKKKDQEKYATIDSVKTAKVAGINGSDQLEAAKANVPTITDYATLTDLVSQVKTDALDVAVMSYKEASSVVKAEEDLVILDAEVEKVPSLLVIGGTHPNEPSGQLTATLFLENAVVERGVLYVITELNRSAYSYSQPQEATSWYYNITTKNGTTRTFKFGSRATNTVDQWPTPDVYTHSSGQQLSSSEVRNINRAYPGSETGTYTEQIAYAITNFVRTKDVTMVIDLHEASPEYLTINACVYHQDASEVITKARSKSFRYGTENKRLEITYDASPENMHGLTHRELGDFTDAYVFLFETSNAAQGKLRGAFTEDLITYSKPDKFYEAAVEYDIENGTQIIYGRPCSINERVARHTLSICSVVDGFNLIGTTRKVQTTKIGHEGQGGEQIGKFIMKNIPSYTDIIDNGVGNYLLD